MSKPKIHLFVNAKWGNGDVIGQAIAEDGTGLAGHVSSSESFLKSDLGYRGTAKHDKYIEHYPDGYELAWVDNPESHAGLQEAIGLARAKEV